MKNAKNTAAVANTVALGKDKDGKPKTYTTLAVAKALATMFFNKVGVEFKVVTKKDGTFNVVPGAAKAAPAAKKAAPAKKVAKTEAPAAKKVPAKKVKTVKADVEGLVEALA